MKNIDEKKKYRTLFFVGLLIFINPFLGIPETWRNSVNIIVGVLIMVVALVLRSKNKTQDEEEIDKLFESEVPQDEILKEEVTYNESNLEEEIADNSLQKKLNYYKEEIEDESKEQK